MAAVAALEKGYGKKLLDQREGGPIRIVVQVKELLLDNFYNGMRTSAHFFNELPRFMGKGKR